MSTRIHVDLAERGYDVVIGDGAVTELGPMLAGRRRAAVVTQAAIPVALADEVRGALDDAGVRNETFLMGEGEDHKTTASVDDLCRRFAQWGLLRGDAVVALGGGVVGDTAGFAAAVYYRGIDVVQVPTTLLAMVDSAIGGKTGVNLPEGKNLVGAFHQPLAVLADPGALFTLADREYRCGLGEVAKYALMDDDFVSARADALSARDPAVLADVIARSAEIKARYVSADELEQSGTRAVLNYGHTLAHALETASGHALLHGEAVARGNARANRPSGGRASRATRGLARAPYPRAARTAGRRRRADHGARQEVGWWAHVHALGAERNRKGRRPGPRRGAQGARRDRYRGIGRTWRRSCCSRDRT